MLEVFVDLIPCRKLKYRYRITATRLTCSIGHRIEVAEHSVALEMYA
jgi:hypothetical protein